MDNLNGIFSKVFEIANKENAEKEGDYYEDGFLMCGNCHTRKQTEIQNGSEIMKVGYACDCRRKAIEEQYSEDANQNRPTDLS